MKRSFLFDRRPVGLLVSGAALVAATYGLVRLAYGLFLPDVQAELPFGAATAGLISSGASVVYCLGRPSVSSPPPDTLAVWSSRPR